MPTPLITDQDRALLEAAADEIVNYLQYSPERAATAALLRRLAVEPTEGLLAFAQGEPNEYFITNNGHWVAAVKFNGELMPAKQEATLRAWLGQQTCMDVYGPSDLDKANAAVERRDNPLSSVRIDGLRRLCGYVENGSDTVVAFLQDDATRSFLVRVGPAASPYVKYFHGAGMLEALDAAIAGTPDQFADEPAPAPAPAPEKPPAERPAPWGCKDGCDWVPFKDGTIGEECCKCGAIIPF